MFRKLTFVAAWMLLAVLAQPATAKDLPTATPEKLGFSSERLDRLDRAMQAEIDAKRKAGMVVLIARHGKIVHLKAFGMANTETATPMRTDNLFRIYSTTKPITSVALLMLYEQGLFQLNDPLEKYIPAFKDVQVLAGVDKDGKMILEKPHRPITIQDVFRHTDGFAGAFESTPVNKAYDDAKLWQGSLADLVGKLATMPLAYHPGEQWKYGPSHEVQAYLVEYFSGMRFDDYCRKHIFEPLGMKDTVFGIPPERLSRFASTHGPDGKGGLRVIDDGRNSPYAGAAKNPRGGSGISTTAADYFRFAQMLLNGGEFNGVRLLGRKTVEYMGTNQLPSAIPEMTLGELRPYGGLGYGLGIAVQTDAAASAGLASNGTMNWGGAATTQIFIDPKEDMVSIIFAQHQPGDFGLFQLFQTMAYQALAK